MVSNEKLIYIMKNSLYPFQFNIDCGKNLFKTYNLICDCYKILKNNQNNFQTIFKKNNIIYNEFLLYNLTLCDQIFMLTHVYLKYPKETVLFHNILSEIENIYFLFFNDEKSFKDNNQIKLYYENIIEIHSIYYKLRNVYNSEMDYKLTLNDRIIMQSKKDRELTLKFFKENNPR